MKICYHTFYGHFTFFLFLCICSCGNLWEIPHSLQVFSQEKSKTNTKQKGKQKQKSHCASYVPPKSFALPLTADGWIQQCLVESFQVKPELYFVFISFLFSRILLEFYHACHVAYVVQALNAVARVSLSLQDLHRQQKTNDPESMNQ